MKLYKFFEYMYVVAALFFAEEAIRTWGEPGNHAYLYLFLMAMAIFMFFFKRKFRKRIEQSKEP